MAAIERTLAAKQRDYDELLLLSGDANHARESALGELDRVRAGYEEERRRREKELRERHQVVQIRRQMLERMKQREKLRSQVGYIIIYVHIYVYMVNFSHCVCDM